MMTEEELIREATKASVPSDVLGVRHCDDGSAIVALRIKGSGVVFGWRFVGGKRPVYVKDSELAKFLPEHVSESVKEQVKAAAAKVATVKKRGIDGNQRRVERMIKESPELYYGMFTVRGNKAVHRIVMSTSMGKDAEETYQAVTDAMCDSDLDCMDECMDTDVREHVWERVLGRHGENLRQQRGHSSRG